MADDQANSGSGGVFNPFEQQPVQQQNNVPLPDASAQLDEIKQDVVKKRKRRRNRRKNVFGGENAGETGAANPGAKAFANNDDSSDDFPDEPPSDEVNDEVEDDIPNAPPSDEASAINPFDHSALPPIQEENRHKEEKLKEEHEKQVQEKHVEAEKNFDEQNVKDDYGEPINPFDSPSVSQNAPAIDTKALEDKPMDRRSDAVDFSPFEDTSSAEEAKFSEEKMEETGSSGENFFAESDHEADRGEIVQEAEVVSRHEEPKSPETVSEFDPKADLHQEVDEFKKDFWSILEQAGITKKHLIGFALFFVVIIVVILFFVFGGMNLFKSDGVVDESKPIVENKPIEEEADVPDTTIDASANKAGQSSEAYGLITSYIVGLQKSNEVKTPIVIDAAKVSGDIAGIDTALLIGIGEKADKIRYQYYIGLLRKLLNIYQTDVYALVDLALDRRKALDDYLKEMNQFINDADGALIEINAIMLDLDARFEKVVEDKNFFETQYFATTEALLTESSYGNLMDYVRVTQDADKLKGFYNAYSFLRDMYNNSLAKIKPRYKDIVLNRDAVVKGIRVFDVPSSDIKAIIRLEQ